MEMLPFKISKEKTTWRTQTRWEGIIKMDLNEICYEDVDWPRTGSSGRLL
jgi:hypothetical protein